MSAVDAIEESVEDVTGSVCSHALRAEIESTIVSTWHEHTERLEGIVQQKATSRGEVSTASVWSDLHLRAAARICKSIEDATAANVVDTIGVSTAREVNRVLLNLTESLARIDREALLNLGLRPGDPRLKSGSS